MTVEIESIATGTQGVLGEVPWVTAADWTKRVEIIGSESLNANQ